MISTAGGPLSPGESLRRLLECVAGGILLPGSPGNFSVPYMYILSLIFLFLNDENDDETEPIVTVVISDLEDEYFVFLYRNHLSVDCAQMIFGKLI